MTTAELIQILSEYPPDIPVVIEGYAGLDIDEDMTEFHYVGLRGGPNDIKVRMISLKNIKHRRWL